MLPGARYRVPRGALAALVIALWATACEAPPRIELLSPRRGSVLPPGDLVVTWRTAGEGVLPGDHYHVFLDRDLPAVGDPIPMDDPRIVHVMGDTTFTFRDVGPGPHRVTVVLGDATHRARGGLYRASVPFRVADTAERTETEAR